MSTYTYTVEDIYNIFGAGHNYRLILFKNGDCVNYWDYDSSFGIGGVLLRAKIKRLRSIYGATRLN